MRAVTALWSNASSHVAKFGTLDRRRMGCRTAAFGSRDLSRAHRRYEVGFPPRRIATTVGGDMNVVEMVGGFVAVVRRPTRCADARVEALPPDHMYLVDS